MRGNHLRDAGILKSVFHGGGDGFAPDFELGKPSLGEGGIERVNHDRIVFRAGMLAQNFQRLGKFRSHLIGTVGGDGVKGVGDGDDAHHQWHLIALDAVGITAAVQGLVMPADARQHFVELLHLAHDLVSHHRVALHDFKLFVGQYAGLFQHAVIDADFSTS